MCRTSTAGINWPARIYTNLKDVFLLVLTKSYVCHGIQGFFDVFVLTAVCQRNQSEKKTPQFGKLVFYAQSTGAVISGRYNLVENTTNLSDPTDRYITPSAFGSVSKTGIKMPAIPLLVSLKEIPPESENTPIATGKGTFQMEDLLGLGMEPKHSLNIAFTDF